MCVAWPDSDMSSVTCEHLFFEITNKIPGIWIMQYGKMLGFFWCGETQCKKRVMNVCIEKYLMWREVTCVCMFLITVICMGVWVCVQHLCVCFAAAASCRHCFSVFIFPRSVSRSHISSWLGQRGGVFPFALNQTGKHERKGEQGKRI